MSAVKREKTMQCGWLDLITDKQNSCKIALRSKLQFYVQVNGVSALQYYAPVLNIHAEKVKRYLCRMCGTSSAELRANGVKMQQ